MKVRDVLQAIRQVRIPEKGYPVEQTAAEELLSWLRSSLPVEPVRPSGMKSEEGVVYLAVATDRIKRSLLKQGMSLPDRGEWVFYDLDGNRCLWLLSSSPCFLFAGLCYLLEELGGIEASRCRQLRREMSFEVEKSTFDIFLTQYARLIRNFKKERYIREYARLGFTHIEVNGLAAAFPAEEGVSGEFYPDFYTYCPAVDQFVSSRLNQGIYPLEYLKDNLAVLKENARLALRYGLVPGLLCFEPRSVPEALFAKYPTLRGARVDHPFRSFKPRFNLSVVHPVVQKHYTELITRLLMEVPELEFLTIWSNDSGAGFEHTKSLYAGRNGGAYLIREWKDDEEIARVAADNIIQFFRLLRDAASQFNPRFRVITRLESFYGERPHLWPRLANRIDVEVNSLLTRGWETHYLHPRYKDVKVLGSAYHHRLAEQEKEPMEELRSRRSQSFFYHSLAAHTNHEPLLGIPFPWLTYEKLRSLRRLGVRTLAHVGGIQPPDKVPFAVNQEVFREFQFNPRMNIQQTVFRIASRYAGEEYADNLVEGWRLVEEAIRAFMPIPLYSHYGTVWQRLLVRPLVPHIDRIPEQERSYYEQFMCSSIHNPNRVDLARDVLFELVSKDYARKAFIRIDANVWEPLQAAVLSFGQNLEAARAAGDRTAFRVFEDQYYRTRALRCLYETLRNTAVWVYAVHEYMETTDRRLRNRCRKLLNEMCRREVLNCRELIQIWKDAAIEWMIISGGEETPFIHAGNFGKLLEKKIALMEEHMDDEPYIDPDYMFRVAHDPYADS